MNLFELKGRRDLVLKTLGCGLIFISLAASAADSLRPLRPAIYTGMADASGAVALSSNLFAVASDEDNVLRVYRRDQGGPPLQQFDFNSFLEVTGKSLEADLEGAARIGNRAFWIGSHGRNRVGKERTNRCRLFATDIGVHGGTVTLTPVGRPYQGLLSALIAEPRFARYDFERAAQRAPKAPGALNIEGLAATADAGLLIGFRSPIPGDKALLIPLLNPNQVVADAPAKFGEALELDLSGLGIRDIAFFENRFIIIAGPDHGGGPFEFYRWAGPGTKPERVRVQGLRPYHPEALIIYPDTGLSEIQVLSDDGKRRIDGVPVHEIQDPARLTFRSFFLRL
jgi:uncharacterized protein DUF3616